MSLIQYKITWKYTVYDPGTKVYNDRVWASNRTEAVKIWRRKVVGPIDVLRIKELDAEPASRP